MRENDVLSRYSELMRLSKHRIVVLIGFRRRCATNCTDFNSLPSSTREVFGGSNPGSHGALQHVSPLTTTITTFPSFQLSTLQIRSSATNTWAHLYFTKPPPTPMLALFRSVRHSPPPPPSSPRHVPIPVLIAHVSPSAPRRTAEGSHTKTSKQDTRIPPQANPRARASRLLFWPAMSTNGQKGDPGRETARRKKRYERFDAAAASHNQPIRVRLGWLHLPLVIPARRRTQVRHIISPCLGASPPDSTLPFPSNQRRPSRSPDLQTPILASGEGSPISDLESIPPSPALGTPPLPIKARESPPPPPLRSHLVLRPLTGYRQQRGRVDLGVHKHALVDR